MVRALKPWFPLLGIAFGIAGLDKLAGLRSYRRLARHWSWRKSDMQLLGAAELAGGAMMAWHPTRRLGGGLLAAASAAALAAEAREHDLGLAVPRGLLCAAALLAAATR